MCKRARVWSAASAVDTGVPPAPPAYLRPNLTPDSFLQRMERSISLVTPESPAAPSHSLAILGPSGCGKSTLLRTLIGLVPRSSGHVQLFGLDPATAALEIRRRASYLPGETGVYQQMRGDAFLDFALGFYPRHDDALRSELLEAFELPLNQRIRSYSAGMKQK